MHPAVAVISQANMKVTAAPLLREQSYFLASRQAKNQQEKTNVLKRRIFHAVASAIMVTGALGQTPNTAQHFAKDVLSFDYPVGWTMDESKTTGQMQYLMLGRNGYATIMVRSPR